MKLRYAKQFDCDSISRAWPDGWQHLVDRVCAAIQTSGQDLRWVQIKEKYGGLRMYFEHQPSRTDLMLATGQIFSFYSDERDRTLDGVLAIIIDMEKDSLKTCCRCGYPGEGRLFDGWILTVCEVCAPIIEEYRRMPGRKPDP